MASVGSPATERRHLSDRRAGYGLSARRMQALDWTALVLMIVGGINWGLVGLFNVDLVASIFGQMSALTRIIYIVVGLAALYAIYTSTKLAQGRPHT